jgi:O-antigen/teichoic acid export membrane protein
MSASQGREKDGSLRIMKGTLIMLILVFLPCCLLVAAGARAGLDLWLGAEFAEKSTRVAQLLALGVALSALGEPAKFLVRAHGKPQLGAAVSIVELVLFALYSVPAISRWGIEGAAMAWVLRAAIGFVLMQSVALWVARRSGTGRDAMPPRSA